MSFHLPWPCLAIPALRASSSSGFHFCFGFPIFLAFLGQTTYYTVNFITIFSKNFLWKRWSMILSSGLNPTWIEHATFWSGVRRATIAPRILLIHVFVTVNSIEYNDRWNVASGASWAATYGCPRLLSVLTICASPNFDASKLIWLYYDKIILKGFYYFFRFIILVIFFLLRNLIYWFDYLYFELRIT